MRVGVLAGDGNEGGVQLGGAQEGSGAGAAFGVGAGVGVGVGVGSTGVGGVLGNDLRNLGSFGLTGSQDVDRVARVFQIDMSDVVAGAAVLDRDLHRVSILEIGLQLVVERDGKIAPILVGQDFRLPAVHAVEVAQRKQKADRHKGIRRNPIDAMRIDAQHLFGTLRGPEEDHRQARA
jgi:hypothetical protein